MINSFGKLASCLQSLLKFIDDELCGLIDFYMVVVDSLTVGFVSLVESLLVVMFIIIVNVALRAKNMKIADV